MTEHKIIDNALDKDLFTKTLSSNQIRTKVKTYEYNKYKPYYFIFEKYKKKYKWLND